MRIPYEELTALANVLVNNTIFKIVKGLMEIQHVNEGHLLQMREQVEQEHQSIYRIDERCGDVVSRVCVLTFDTRPQTKSTRGRPRSRTAESWSTLCI